MKEFDRNAFLQEMEKVDDTEWLADFDEIGIVVSDTDEDTRKALKNFVRFMSQADRPDAEGEPPQERISFEELLEISRRLNNIVQVLAGDFSVTLFDLVHNLKKVKNEAGKRRIL